MPTQLDIHPTAADLRAFAHGRLAADQIQAIESHVSSCDQCCQQLATVPDDTLVQLARAAATQGVRSADTPASTQPKADPREIPAELRDHPKYHVLGLVAAGGMGAVYKAQHRLMERLVALKVISPSLLASPAAVERFLREFKAAARLSHPNIVAAHDAEKAGDLHVLVMEFVEGLSLDRLVGQTGAMSPAQACGLIRQAALGLAHMQEKGLVHRDIKPQNLMVTRKGQLKILDCGLARLSSQPADAPATDSSATKPDATAQGMILGTPDYISPEQIADARLADIRADIYSLGCTLYFLLTGQPPFPRGSVLDKLASHASHPPEPIATRRNDISPELARILDRMMAKDPAERYQTPAAVAKDLAPLAKGQAGDLLASGRPGTAAQRGSPPGESPTPVLAPLPPTIDEPFPPPVAAPADQSVVLSTEYSILGTASSARRSQTRSKQFNPLIIAAVAVAGIGLLLGIPLAWSMLSGTDPPAQPAANRQALSVNNPQPAINSKPALAPTAPLPRRVLLVVPSQGLWYPDYVDVKSALEAKNTNVVAASTSRGRCQLRAGSRQGDVYPDVVLDSSVKASNYGAIAFAGFDTQEFHPGSQAGNHVRRLLQEFKTQGKPITAICAGQRVLALHGELDGKKVAKCGFVDASFGNCQADWRGTSVERDGLLITAARDSDAAVFASAIVAALDAR